MSLTLQEESALTLPLQGTVGSFRIGGGLSSQTSLEVKYFLTHVGLNFSAPTNDALLRELAPVREIFDFRSLDFEEIMQRDIDDSRVSHELIPYLLDEQSRDLIKLFPPVVVVVLPLRLGEKKPAKFYSRVTRSVAVEETSEKHGLHVIRSGEIGHEVFQFEQPIHKGRLLEHDLVKLRLNTNRCCLVIVDGQHRAMALLALYRNLKDEWSDERRAPFKDYYSEWTSNYINQFKLDEINLPLMICTVPALDEDYAGEFDLIKAARSIFLTLNKNARKVSESRNRLLDDNDLISSFLRECLSVVKQKDSRSEFSFRISSVELDQFGDKLKIQSPIALTGVNHLYYIIEHMMLSDGDVKGVSSRSGKFYKRTDLEAYGCLARVDGRNKLGQQLADTTKRDSFSAKAERILTKSFDERFGSYIVNSFERFVPWECHNKAALTLEADLAKHKDRQLRPILFEGQGIGRVFDSHRQKLAEKLKQGAFTTDVPEIEATKKSLDATAERLANAVADFQTARADFFTASLSDKGKVRDDSGNIYPFVVRWLNQFYDNVLTTVAFQAAFICGFFQDLEKADLERNKSGGDDGDRQSIFSEYVEQLNEFFVPKSSAQLKRLIRVFDGDLSGSNAGEWKIVPTKFDFRSVVYRSEMQPDQWPKYKYLLLEIWSPSDEYLAKINSAERSYCRNQVFSSLYQTYKSEYCRENLKLEEKLKDSELSRIVKRTHEAFVGFLRNVTSGELPTLEETRAIVETVSEEPDEAEETGSVTSLATSDD
jgi:hypothetical protein